MKYYLQFAKRIGNEGNVGLRFTLNKDGTLKGSVEILKSCIHEMLNNAGITTIKNAGPYPSFPDELVKVIQETTFVVNLDYNLRFESVK